MLIQFSSSGLLHRCYKQRTGIGFTENCILRKTSSRVAKIDQKLKEIRREKGSGDKSGVLVNACSSAYSAVSNERLRVWWNKPKQIKRTFPHIVFKNVVTCVVCTFIENYIHV